ncbi:MAG: class IV adenylate cyclase [Deltaproteobacteria bacterium]|nr:class IV adenylate cyclase [Deltaproteobacteria bacterium]
MLRSKAMPNIEIKVPYSDLEKARRIAREHHTEYVGVLRQTDTYFKTVAGRLKLREFGAGRPAQLIPYQKTYDAAVPMRSDYALLPVEDPAQVKRLLGALLGQEFVVDKTREVFLIENVRVHLDQVAGLGNFVEFEAVFTDDTPDARARETARIDRLMQLFGISAADLMRQSYVDCLEALARRPIQPPYNDSATTSTAEIAKH